MAAMAQLQVKVGVAWRFEGLQGPARVQGRGLQRSWVAAVQGVAGGGTPLSQQPPYRASVRTRRRRRCVAKAFNRGYLWDNLFSPEGVLVGQSFSPCNVVHAWHSASSAINAQHSVGIKSVVVTVGYRKIRTGQMAADAAKVLGEVVEVSNCLTCR